jgi:toxoflavin synthase
MKGKAITYGAESYVNTKNSPFREVVERHTIFSLIGDPTGLRILDAGCGDGIYARQLVDLGAEHVIGVDGAADFIELAREKSIDYSDTIEYHKAFIQNFFGAGDLDLVVASYLLSYPQNLTEATEYCRAMASHLKDGAKFVGFNNNPFEVFQGERYSEYGFRKVMTSSEEGAEVKYLIDKMADPIINFYLTPETYEQAFRNAGFSKFEWRAVQLHPREQRSPHWDEFFKSPKKFPSPFIAMIATK